MGRLQEKKAVRLTWLCGHELSSSAHAEGGVYLSQITHADRELSKQNQSRNLFRFDVPKHVPDTDMTKHLSGRWAAELFLQPSSFAIVSLRITSMPSQRQ